MRTRGVQLFLPENTKSSRKISVCFRSLLTVERERVRVFLCISFRGDTSHSILALAVSFNLHEQCRMANKL